jgi:hypothetical protein
MPAILVLATLGNANKIELFLFAMPPKEAKAGKDVNIIATSSTFLATNFPIFIIWTAEFPQNG